VSGLRGWPGAPRLRACHLRGADQSERCVHVPAQIGPLCVKRRDVRHERDRVAGPQVEPAYLRTERQIGCAPERLALGIRNVAQPQQIEGDFPSPDLLDARHHCGVPYPLGPSPAVAVASDSMIGAVR